MSLSRVYIAGALVLAVAAALAWHTWVVDKLQKALAAETLRAVTAEASLAEALSAKERLEATVASLEQSVKEAQQKRTVIYKEVQKEVAKDEASRNWYDAPLPDGIRRVLKSAAAGAGNSGAKAGDVAGK